MTIVFVPVATLFVIVIARISTLRVQLDIASLQNSGIGEAIGQLQAEAIAIAAGLAVVNDDHFVGERSRAIDPGGTFDLPSHGIDDGVGRHARALNPQAIMARLVVGESAPELPILDATGDGKDG